MADSAAFGEADARETVLAVLRFFKVLLLLLRSPFSSSIVTSYGDA